MVLAEQCKKFNVPFSMVNNMLITVKDISKHARRRNIFTRLKAHLETELKDPIAVP